MRGAGYGLTVRASRHHATHDAATSESRARWLPARIDWLISAALLGLAASSLFAAFVVPTLFVGTIVIVIGTERLYGAALEKRGSLALPRIVLALGWLLFAARVLYAPRLTPEVIEGAMVALLLASAAWRARQWYANEVPMPWALASAGGFAAAALAMFSAGAGAEPLAGIAAAAAMELLAIGCDWMTTRRLMVSAPRQNASFALWGRGVAPVGI